VADGKLTTHALDTQSGKPAYGLAFVLYRFSEGFGSERAEIARGELGPDGRPPSAILSATTFKVGEYCLEFDAESYFGQRSDEVIDPFLGLISLNFRITDESTHYHIPLILAPFGYSTYRGS